MSGQWAMAPVREAITVLWSQVLKDIVVWTRRPLMISATIAPAIAYMFITFFVSFTIGRNPVALVTDGTGPSATRLAAVIQQSNEFIARPMTHAEAKVALDKMEVEAIITIPATFDATLGRHQATAVSMVVNNVNADEADDLRRALPTAITDFYESAPHNPMRVSMAETDMHANDFTLGQYEFIPIVVFVTTISGIISAGFMASQEWETGTINELLLAPAGRWLLVVAKLTSGWLMTVALVAVTIFIGAMAGFLVLPPGALVPAVLMVLLMSLAGAGIGNALGLTLRYIGKVQAFGVQIAVNAFFFSGGVSVVAFLPDAFQKISRFVPTYYAVHSLDQSILYGSSQYAARDFAIVGCVAGASILWTVAVFRRQTL